MQDLFHSLKQILVHVQASFGLKESRCEMKRRMPVEDWLKWQDEKTFEKEKRENENENKNKTNQKI